MAAPPPAVLSNPPQETIPVSGSAGIGNLTITPPTFLEKWGIVFVSVGGLWMLGVCIAMLWYYLAHLSLPPAQTPTMKPEDYKAILELQKTATDQFRDSLNFAFDLMVTKTILPLLTLLLGYLFGSKKS
ncbi:MAG TPA: hypothetical protein VHX60_04785 [Acidobacteriaceae bacterium]|jgi:hypothetical protein|nr:hypothetical protein [Acidobacteriaceae bacterium]